MNQKGGNFEPNPVSLCMDIPDAKISEIKKKKKKKKNRKKGNSAKNCDGFLDNPQNCSSVGMQNSDDCSKMSNHGSDEVGSDSFLEDFSGSRPYAVLQCGKVELGGLDSKGSVCEDSKIGSGKACLRSGKEYRNLGWYWQKRQHNDRDAQRCSVNEPSYRFGARHVHPVENRVRVEHNSLSANCLLSASVALCMDMPDASISENKKNRKKGNSARNCDGFLDNTQNCSSVGMQNSDDNSKMSNHGSKEVSSDSFLEDIPATRPSAVLQWSKVKLGELDSNGSVCENSKIGSGKACARSGKENWNWQKRHHNARDAQRRSVKEPNYRYGEKHGQPQENRVSVEHISLSGNCLLPNPLDESLQWAASQQRLNESLYKNVSRPNHSQGSENDDGGLIGRSTNSYWREKNGLGNCKNRDTARMFYDGHHVASHGYKHSVKSSSVYSNTSTQGVMNGIQPHKFMKIPITEPNFGRCLYAPLGGKPFSEFRYHIDHKFRRDVTSARAKKWKPVGTKESWPMEGVFSAGTCNASNLDLPVLSNGLSDSHPEGSSVPFPSSVTFSDTNTNSISCHQLPSAYYDHPKFHKSTAETEDQKIERQGYEANGSRPKDTVELLIGSQMAVEALNASYRMQLASEIVQLAMGCPLAEFERFIHCAAPVIASSYVHKKCSVCLDNQLSHNFLCKHQIPNLSLSSVWNWYEKPGNYGLDVKVDDSKNLNGSMSFHAHFVPYLSAVQLFRCQNPGSKTLSSTHSSEAAKLNNLQAGAENFDSVKEPVGSFDVVLCEGSSPLSLDFSLDFELIFEFFESEQPHQRKPFYNKIVELIGVGTSNDHIFGDPSKLGCLNLHDLHPASWFSAAWYPIYRIPEGSFRASFLTYHSLGHFVQRPVSVDASNKYISHIFSPVLGLQSCNAQGECWFDPKIPFGYSSKEPISSNNTEILKERLTTLEDNALRFARGCVCKDKVMVSNRHPDFEFFNSRKPRYK